MLRNLSICLTLASALVAGAALGKPIVNKFGTVENGKMSKQSLTELTTVVQQTQSTITQQHYEEIVADPQKARTDEERVVGLSAREFFLLVDRSGSMSAPDENPTGGSSSSWTRWNSAKVAGESLLELAIALDADNKVEVIFWDGDPYTNRLRTVEKTITNVTELEPMFQQNGPGGGTPLAEALQHVYQSRLTPLAA